MLVSSFRSLNHGKKMAPFVVKCYRLYPELPFLDKARFRVKQQLSVLLLLILIYVLCGTTCAQNVKFSNSSFERELDSTFSKRLKKKVTVLAQPLRQGSTNAGLSTVKHYFWVKINSGNSLIEEGAVRAAADESNLEIHHFWE
jgi:hypothetical protein